MGAVLVDRPPQGCTRSTSEATSACRHSRATAPTCTCSWRTSRKAPPRPRTAAAEPWWGSVPEHRWSSSRHKRLSHGEYQCQTQAAWVSVPHTGARSRGGCNPGAVVDVLFENVVGWMTGSRWLLSVTITGCAADVFLSFAMTALSMWPPLRGTLSREAASKITLTNNNNNKNNHKHEH